MSESLCCVDEGTQALAAEFLALGAGSGGWHVQECVACSGGCFPPRLRCPHCGSPQLRWAPVGKIATLVSVILVQGENPRHKAPRLLRRPEGYATGIVALDGWPDVRFPVLIEGEQAAIAAVGMRVEIGSALLGKRTVPTAHLQLAHDRYAEYHARA